MGLSRNYKTNELARFGTELSTLGTILKPWRPSINSVIIIGLSWNCKANELARFGTKLTTLGTILRPWRPSINSAIIVSVSEAWDQDSCDWGLLRNKLTNDVEVLSGDCILDIVKAYY